MANRIPRHTTEMDVEFLTATSAGNPGTKMKARKDEHGWHGTDKNGKSWALFLTFLRCSELCRLSNMK